jgi:hypothetical protein
MPNLAIVLGRVAAGIVFIFLIVSAVFSVAMNVKYGHVARHHAPSASVSAASVDRMAAAAQPV